MPARPGATNKHTKKGKTAPNVTMAGLSHFVYGLPFPVRIAGPFFAFIKAHNSRVFFLLPVYGLPFPVRIAHPAGLGGLLSVR